MTKNTNTTPVWNFVPVVAESGAYKVTDSFEQESKRGTITFTVGLAIPFRTADGKSVDLLISTSHLERAETAAVKLFAADDGSDIAARWGSAPATRKRGPRKDASSTNGAKDDANV